MEATPPRSGDANTNGDSLRKNGVTDLSWPLLRGNESYPRGGIGSCAARFGHGPLVQRLTARVSQRRTSSACPVGAASRPPTRAIPSRVGRFAGVAKSAGHASPAFASVRTVGNTCPWLAGVVFANPTRTRTARTRGDEIMPTKGGCRHWPLHGPLSREKLL